MKIGKIDINTVGLNLAYSISIFKKLLDGTSH